VCSSDLYTDIREDRAIHRFHFTLKLRNEWSLEQLRSVRIQKRDGKRVKKCELNWTRFSLHLLPISGIMSLHEGDRRPNWSDSFPLFTPGALQVQVETPRPRRDHRVPYNR
jgi:hypothetical protein